MRLKRLPYGVTWGEVLVGLVICGCVFMAGFYEGRRRGNDVGVKSMATTFVRGLVKDGMLSAGSVTELEKKYPWLKEGK